MRKRKYGKHSDGSFTLSPEAFSKMKTLLLWRGDGLRGQSHAERIDALYEAIENKEHGDPGFEQLT